MMHNPGSHAIKRTRRQQTLSSDRDLLLIRSVQETFSSLGWRRAPSPTARFNNTRSTVEPIVRVERHTDVIQRSSRVGACVIGLMLCVAACSSGGKHAAPTTVKAKAPTRLAPTTWQPPTGTLVGILRAVGGPAPGIDRAISGPITIVGSNGRRWRVEASARHGFAVKLPTGRYQVTGGGVNGTIECYGPPWALVARDQLTRVPVVCDED
jgi:hypothetical protein